MELIMREFEWVEGLMNNRVLPGKPYKFFESLARYYTSMGYNDAQIKDAIKDYTLLCNPTAAFFKEYGLVLDTALKSSKKREPISVDNIVITQPELDSISAIDNLSAKKMAFSALCIAKFRDKVNPDNNHWVNEKLSVITAAANVRTSIKNQCLIYNMLQGYGLIEFAKRPDSNNMRVLFIQDGDEAARITSLKDLGNRYLMLCGKPYFECCECGAVSKYRTPSNPRGQKYCDNCSCLVAYNQRVASNKARRNSGKIVNDENLNL